MRILRQLCLALLVSAAATLANAQSLSEKAQNVSGIDFVRVFVGFCAQNAGNNKRVIDAANALGLRDLPPEFEPLLAPQAPEARFTGLMELEGEGAPYFLGVSWGKDRGQPLETCAVANPYIDTDQVVSSLKKVLSLREPSYDETSAGQRFRLWRTEEISVGSFVSLTDAQPMGIGGATLSITSPPMN